MEGAPFTKLYHQWFNTVLPPISNLAEMKIVFYVFRHTVGFRQTEVCISTDEFRHGRKCHDGNRMDDGTGLSEKSVIAGVKSAIKNGRISKRVDDSNKARIRMYYSIPHIFDLQDSQTENTSDLQVPQIQTTTSSRSRSRKPPDSDLADLETENENDASSDGSRVASTGSKQPAKERRKKGERKLVASTPAIPEITLSERARIVYESWCKAPWFKGTTPKLTPTVAKHCAALAEYDPLPTTEDMKHTRHWYAKKHPDQSGFQLGNFVAAYPDYLSDQYRPSPESGPSSYQGLPGIRNLSRLPTPKSTGVPNGNNATT